MSKRTFGPRKLKWPAMAGLTSALILSVVLAFSWVPARAPAAPPAGAGAGREHSEGHGPAEHAKEAGALKMAFDGPVDLYFEPAQLSAAKPGVAGARFVDIVDVTGKALLRFEKDGDRWLIDPDAIIAFRIAKAR